MSIGESHIQLKMGVSIMNQQQVGLWAKAAAGLLMAVAAFGACAQQVIVYTYQGQAFSTQYDASGRIDDSGSPVYYTDIDEPGIAFSFIVDAPIQAGQTVSLAGFMGVMGQNGSFASWNFQNCQYSACLISKNASNEEIQDSASWYAGHGTIQQFNLNEPGTWSQRAVTIGPYDGVLTSHYYMREAYVVEWVRPVPEADAGLMAVLGAAAVGVLARRQSRTA